MAAASSAQAAFETSVAQDVPMLAQAAVPTTGTYSAIMLASIFFFAVYAFRLSHQDNKQRRIPRGPRGLPIVGSFFSLTKFPEVTLTKWQETYGPLFSIHVGNQLFVVIGDQGYAKELMITNGKDFASRKPNFVKSQLVMKGGGITTTPYGPRWRQHRRLAATILDNASVERLTPVFNRESIILCKALLDQGAGGLLPVDPGVFVGRFTLNNILHVVFGKRTSSIDDPLVAKALEISREFMNCTGAVANLIDFVEILQYFPSEMRTRGRNLHNALVETYGGMIKEVETKLKRNEDVPESFAKNMLLCREEEGISWTDMCTLTGALMIGGVETTGSVIQWFMALMSEYPEIQARAQAELDAVVGRDCLPSEADAQDLPYVRAIIKEVQRCRNPFWLTTPHYSTADYTTSSGEFIPKGTVILLNTHAIHHNPARYPDPYTFNPDRYLDDNLTAGQSMHQGDPYLRDHWIYGAGRRVCPGYAVAEREIFLVISRVLWAFRIESVPEEPIDLQEYDGAAGRSPVHFRVRYVPRHENVELVLDVADTYTSP